MTIIFYTLALFMFFGEIKMKYGKNFYGFFENDLQDNRV